MPEISQESVLKLGVRGEGVRYLQNMLISIGCNLGPSGVDGVFGKSTEFAIRSLQKDNGIRADGRIDKDTVRVICSLVLHNLPPYREAEFYR